LRLKSEEGTGEHKHEGTENDEGQSGTICSANNGKGDANNGTNSQIDYKDTTNDNSTRNTTKGAEARGTTDNMSIGETIEGAELRS